MTVRPSCCSAVCLSVHVSIPEQICGWISLILHTHIISFNMPDIWPHFVSGDLGNPWVDPFHISHTHTFVPIGAHKV